MELTYNKPLEIKCYTAKDLMELEDGSVLRLLGRKPGREGEKIILKKKDDSKPGGPFGHKFTTVVMAGNVNGGEPQPVAMVKAPSISDQPTDVKKNYTAEDVKTQQEYKILEIYPEQDSFRLSCGKFMIDKLAILKGKRFDYGEDDIIVLYPAATMTGRKDKFRAVNTSRKNQEALVKFTPTN